MRTSELGHNFAANHPHWKLDTCCLSKSNGLPATVTRPFSNGERSPNANFVGFGLRQEQRDSTQHNVQSASVNSLSNLVQILPALDS